MTSTSPKTNPFYAGEFNGRPYYTQSAEERVRAVRTFTAEQCRAAETVPGLQKTAMQAIKRRLKQLEKQQTTAYCWASGLIEFGNVVPDGAIPIITGEDEKIRSVIEGTARLSHDNENLLVPGVPEAASQREGVLALERYVEWLNQHRSLQ